MTRKRYTKQQQARVWRRSAFHRVEMPCCGKKTRNILITAILICDGYGR
jgi:hypothetical protein